MDELEILQIRETIRDLYSRYALTMDYAQGEQFAACFTEDGSMNIIPGDKIFKGRDVLCEFVTTFAEGRPRHIITNLFFDVINQDSVRCKAYILLLSNEGGEIVGNGTYNDLIVRDKDNKWRYQEKLVHIEWKSPVYTSRISSM